MIQIQKGEEGILVHPQPVHETLPRNTVNLQLDPTQVNPTCGWALDSGLHTHTHTHPGKFVQQRLSESCTPTTCVRTRSVQRKSPRVKRKALYVTFNS